MNLKYGEIITIKMQAPLNVIQGYIKSKWRAEQLKLISMKEINGAYALTFKQMKRSAPREPKIYNSKFQEEMRNDGW